MLNNKLVILCFSLPLLIGCMDRDFHKYLGYWESHEDNEIHRVLEFERHLGTIFVNLNFLENQDGYTDSKSFAIKKDNAGQMYVDFGHDSFYSRSPLDLSEDDEVIKIDKQYFYRISKREAKEIKLEVKRQELVDKENSKLCGELYHVYKDRVSQLNEKNHNREIKLEKTNAIRVDFKARRNAIPQCGFAIY